jgi:hypothetical protein
MGESRCFLYAICHQIDGEFVGPVKIGISASPPARLRELQTGSPHKLAVVFCALLDSRARASRMERMLHEDAAEWAMSGEWFNICPDTALGMLATAIIFEHGHQVVAAENRQATIQ